MRKPRSAIVMVAALLAFSVVHRHGQEDVRAQSAHQGHGAAGEDVFARDMQRSMDRMMTDMHAAAASGKGNKRPPTSWKPADLRSGALSGLSSRCAVIASRARTVFVGGVGVDVVVRGIMS